MGLDSRIPSESRSSVCTLNEHQDVAVLAVASLVRDAGIKEGRRLVQRYPSHLDVGVCRENSSRSLANRNIAIGGRKISTHMHIISKTINSCQSKAGTSPEPSDNRFKGRYP